MNLAADLERRAAEAPDAVGLYSDDGREWTYAELDARAAAVAASAQLLERILFAALVALNSFVGLPAWAIAAATTFSTWCLVTAIAALGMKTSLPWLGPFWKAWCAGKWRRPISTPGKVVGMRATVMPRSSVSLSK